jgi:DNA-binding NtrC family response regulator
MELLKSLPHEGPDKTEKATALPVRKPRVLVIDDEPMIGSAIRRALFSRHEVVTLTLGKQALAQLHAGEHFDVILCDLMMPQMSGMDFHQELCRIRPDLVHKIIYMSGGAFTPKAHDFIRQLDKTRLLEKPVDPTVLLSTVNEVAKQP